MVKRGERVVHDLQSVQLELKYSNENERIINECYSIYSSQLSSFEKKRQ